MIIEDYYARLDGPRPRTALDVVEPEVEFLIALPGAEVRGAGLADLEAYIAGRPRVGRRHRVLRRSSDGDLEMVYGVITEGGDADGSGGRGTGSFSSVALLSPARKVLRYQAFFHPKFGMFPLPGQDAA